MQPTRRKTGTALKWPGGKSYLARRIVQLMPAHESYTEPFAGGLSVLLNKPRAGRETVGDLDRKLIMFWQTVADADEMRFHRMMERARFNKYTPETFALARNYVDNPPWPLAEIDRAEFAAFYLMRNRMSRGGMGVNFGWSDRIRRGLPGDLSAWVSALDELPRIAERLKGVEIRNDSAIATITREDARGTLHYCDPPYMPSTRTARKVYAHEMSPKDHADLIDVLCECRGPAMLSGYRCDLYDHALAQWERTEIDMPNHAGQGKTKQRRVEVVWSKGAGRVRIGPVTKQELMFAE